jgi:hypothetical protein
MDAPDNDNFLAGIGLNSLNVSHVNGTVARQDLRPNISSRVRYNRVWYVYQTTKEYIQNDSAENMKDSVREMLRNMSDKATKVNRGCGQAECPEIGDIWRSDQPVLIQEAVSQGINQELRKLENHPEYFNGNEVSCSFEFKEKRNPDGEIVNYPTWEYIPVPSESEECSKETVGGCGTCTCDTSYQEDGASTKRVDAREDPPGGGDDGGAGVCPCGEWSDNEIQGTSSSAMHWNVWADIKVTCTDEKYNSIPREQKLENLTWRFDMNFKVEERSVDNPFVCEGSDVSADFACTHAYDKKPWSLRQCAVSSAAQQPICDSGVNTVEQTR